MAGRGRPKAVVAVSDEDRVVLERWSKRPKSPMSVAQRARIVLLAADGLMGLPPNRGGFVNGFRVIDVAAPLYHSDVCCGVLSDVRRRFHAAVDMEAEARVSSNSTGAIIPVLV